MKQYVLWPVLVVIYWVGFDIYERLKPCSGFFVGFCALGTFLLKSMLIESVIVYAILAFGLYLWKRKKRQYPQWFELLVVGVASIGIVFGGLLWEIDPLVFVTLPFMTTPMWIVEWFSQ